MCTETILVIDDDEGLVTAVTKVLLAQGYTVLGSSNVKRALIIGEKLKKPIHLILIDVVMPFLNGPQVIDLLKKARSDFKVLYMSGYCNEAFFPYTALAEKEENLIQKPFKPMELTQKIREVLDKN